MRSKSTRIKRRSGNTQKKKSIPLNVETVQQIHPWEKRKTAQESIPFEYIYQNGIVSLGHKQYSMTCRVGDTNYTNVSNDIRAVLYQRWGDYLNSIDDTVRMQIHVLRKPLSATNINLDLPISPDLSAESKELLEEYNTINRWRITGSDSYIQQIFVTFTLVAEDVETAERRLARVCNDAVNSLADINSSVTIFNGQDMIALLREIYRPDGVTPLDKNHILKTGMDQKDLIAPFSMEMTDSGGYGKWGEYYVKPFFIYDFPREMTDQIVNHITSINADLLFTITLVPQNNKLAIDNLRKLLKSHDMERYKTVERQVKHGVFTPTLPRELLENIENLQQIIGDLQSKDERLFLANISVMLRDKNKEQMENIYSAIESEVVRDGCNIAPYTYGVEDALNTIVPLGRLDVMQRSTFTTSAISGFVPFNVVDILQPGGLCYGKNRNSNNILLMNRKLYTNAHGFYFGTSGSGKSMGAKLEIWEVAHRTKDPILIIDPDGEFTKIVEALDGQIVELSDQSTVYINPFDINLDYGGEDENFVAFKSSYIISLLDIAVHRNGGLDQATRSIIDNCVSEIYQKYAESGRDEDIPTFPDFYAALTKRNDAEAKLLAREIEMYVIGSLNIFSHRTNVSLNNRIICFNTKRLSKQLRTMGMAIIQDFCWNVITRGQVENKNTWLYNDEIHLSMKNEVTSSWLIESWKRGRKYGLIATGMTQEVNDVLLNPEARSLISNSEFIMLYRQKPSALSMLQEVMDLSEEQCQKLLTYDSGMGIFKVGNSIVEFDNRISENTKLYHLMETNVGKNEVSQ